MYYENLPIFRSAMNLAVYIETIVKSFEKYHCVLTAGTLHEFFDKKINAVSLYSQTPSSSDISNKYQHTSKPISSKISANFFAVFTLPTGCRASEGHSINFAKQNSSNVPTVQTQKQQIVELAHAKHANSYNLINTTGVIHESNPFNFNRS